MIVIINSMCYKISAQLNSFSIDNWPFLAVAYTMLFRIAFTFSIWTLVIRGCICDLTMYRYQKSRLIWKFTNWFMFSIVTYWRRQETIALSSQPITLRFEFVRFLFSLSLLWRLLAMKVVSTNQFIYWLYKVCSKTFTYVTNSLIIRSFRLMSKLQFHTVLHIWMKSK